MNLYASLLLSALLNFNACSDSVVKNDTILSLSDKNATQQTVNLYQKLGQLTQKGILFGHQDDLAYGVNWRYEKGRSDVNEVVGDYPAVYGWDIAGIENDKSVNIDGVPFDKMKSYITESNARGGINTISWHFDNPESGKNAWDNQENSLKTILPDEKNHKKFTSWLDKSAVFFLSLKDKNGKNIPILFRPFHELTGNWFWWGKGKCEPEDFKRAWKFTKDYLQKKGVHNLIYVYNTADFKTKEEFLEYYPGDNYADILSFDKYQYKDPTKDNSFVEDCQKQFKIMNEVAQEKDKLMAFAETGYEQIPYANWWTDTLLKAIGDYRISYVLVWRNHGFNEHMNPPHMHYYAPYTGQKSAADFVRFYQLPQTLFEKDIQ
ncbi:glycoside hydrolase family 26 protein [Flavobacterium agrisoli]|uniref:Mannan endo-1,4-beta-mannosidase n=1 Tax=Flavobacterium agrisoli TaxID=2793066 RepID=A0A934PJ73_9FLAO|nr:glycosyl hydrolase [Flavobacterium agrisoli]MBK0369102.1 beta-mannosidase [Flavobacterium agrisoli]